MCVPRLLIVLSEKSGSRLNSYDGWTIADVVATFGQLHQDEWLVMLTCMPGSAAERMSCPAFGEAYVNHVYACVQHSCIVVDVAAQY